MLHACNALYGKFKGVPPLEGLPSSHGRCTRGLSLCVHHLLGLGLQGLRTASALMEAATSRAQSEATAPAVPLQHQSAAVLGSGLLTYPPPAAQQHNPGPATDRSQRPRPALSELPRPTGAPRRSGSRPASLALCCPASHTIQEG